MLAFALLLRRTLLSEKRRPPCGLGGPIGVISPADSNISNNDQFDRDTTEVCGTINSLSVDGSTESAGVTTFVSEACEAVDVLGKHYRPNKGPVAQPALQDVKEFFSRPRLMWNGSLPATRSSVVVNTLDLAGMLSTVFSSGNVRLRGAYGMRFKTVFTLQVSATPFHQGVLCMSFQYSDTQYSTRSFIRSSLSESCTNLPHVRLDLSNSTMAQLHVPFLSTYEYLPLSDSNPYGVFALNMLTPCPTVATMAAPTYKMYVHFEDIDLLGALPFETSLVTVQSGKSVKPMNKEFEDDAYPFSSALSSMSRTLRYVSKGVPLISSIAGPPMWYLNKLAGAVRSFGYAIPANQEPPQRVLSLVAPLDQHVDVTSSSQIVGPTISNQLKVDPAFASTDVDEMALAYVLGQWSQVCYFSYDGTSPHGTALYGAMVSPSSLWWRAPTALPAGNFEGPVTTTVTSNAFLPSNLFFWGSMFRMWKGGFKFRFTFSKTQFHAGRVFASFIPANTVGDTYTDSAPVVTVPGTANFLCQPSGYSAVFDLKDSNIFEFDVPYTGHAHYTRFTDAIGHLSLMVMDPLIAPSTVASSIQVLVEVKAASDFELAIPRGPQYEPHVRGTVRQQSGKVVAVMEPACELTIGEAITSAKQLISIPHSVRLGTIKAPIGSSYTTTIGVPPWWYQPLKSVLVPAASSASFMAFSYASAIAPCYAFVRGSTDVSIIANSNGSVSLEAYTSRLDYSTDVVTSFTTGGTNVRQGTVSSVSHTAGDSQLHVRFPAYQPNVRFNSYSMAGLTWDPSVKADQTGLGAPTFTDTQNKFGAPVVHGCIDLTAIPPYTPLATATQKFLINLIMRRRAGDDAMLGHYMGPPPLWAPPGAVAGVYDVSYTNTASTTA